MSKLKLPRLPATERPPLPAEFAYLADEAGGPSVTVLLGRREFLKAATLLLAALVVPLKPVPRAWARARGRFFTRAEFRTLQALVDRVIPPDRRPGARAMGAAEYIEGLLTAFEAKGAPRIFAGGPFSGRNPFPNDRTGKPSGRRPRNDFKHFIPLTRLQELYWRAQLYGSDSLPGVNFNDAAFGGPVLGLRQIYRDGLAKVDQVARAVAGAPFARLSRARQDAVFAVLDAPGMFARDPRRGATFIDLVIRHTLEGCLSVPEYGGNRRRRGWKLVGLQGDVHPLGYSIFSTRRDDYRERRKLPMSTPNPNEVRGGQVRPRPLADVSKEIQRVIVVGSGFFGDGCE